MNHDICDACETCAHCLKNGCIPITTTLKPGDVVNVYFGGKLFQKDVVIKSICNGRVEAESLSFPVITPSLLSATKELR